MDSTAGVPFGRYKLGRRLATGGMGEVWLALQPGLGDFHKPLALKLLLPHLATRPEAVNSFLAEARLAARMSHPNVAQVFDVGEHEGRFFIAMELVRGVSLSTLTRQLERAAALPTVEQVAHLAGSLCDGLHHAHELTGPDGRPLGLVHRDVTPHNVLVGHDGQVKLTDFGVALVQTTPGELSAPVGKTAYLPPEQRGGRTVDRRADIYAAGLTVLAFATSTSPRGNLQPDELSRDLLHRLSARADFPRSFAEALARAVAPEAEVRFATARAFRQAIPPTSSTDGAESLGALVTRHCRSELSALDEKTNLVMQVSGTQSVKSERRVALRRWALALGMGLVVGLGTLIALRSPRLAVTAPALSARTEVPVRETAEEAGNKAPVAGLSDADWLLDLSVDSDTNGTNEETTALPTPPRRPAKKTRPPSAPIRAGYLVVDARPWAQVFVKGRFVGETPLFRLPLETGSTEIVLKNPNTGKSERRVVQVRAGENVTIRADLR